MATKKKSTKKKASKKVVKKTTKKKVVKKTSRKNPRDGEVFRQRREKQLYEARGPQYPSWLEEATGKEAEKAREKIRKEWYKNLREEARSERDYQD